MFCLFRGNDGSGNSLKGFERIEDIGGWMSPSTKEGYESGFHVCIDKTKLEFRMKIKK